MTTRVRALLVAAFALGGCVREGVRPVPTTTAPARRDVEAEVATAPSTGRAPSLSPQEPPEGGGVDAPIRFERKPCAQAASPPNRREHDLTGDGRPDMQELVNSRASLICRETDLNSDGRSDMVRFVNGSGETVREEMDLNFDGSLDVLYLYRRGQELARFTDVDGDGRGDTYTCVLENGILETRQDSDGDGRVDEWSWHREGEQPLGTSGDADGDGLPDRRPPSIPSFSCPEPAF